MSARVIVALTFFAAVVTLPFWSNLGGREMPVPEILPGPTECVESREFMRANHMKLLDQWRDSVVREGVRDYVNAKGQHFKMSLSETCMECHSNKERFCDRCHNSIGVKNYCWNCHLTPDLMKGSTNE
jgi:hypothetical protein